VIDFIVLLAKISQVIEVSLNSSLPFTWHGIIFNPVYRKGRIVWYDGQYENLHLRLTEYELRISNSLHKFYKGNNYSDFNYSEIKSAITLICIRFNLIPKDVYVKKLEFGFNIIIDKPVKEYIECFHSFKHRDFDKMRHKTIEYGRKCFLNEYAIKCYDKKSQVSINDKIPLTENLMRIEMCYSNPRKLPDIYTLQDLLDYNSIKRLFNLLIGVIKQTVFIAHYDFSNTSSQERELFYASLHHEFIKTEQRLNKERTKEIKRRIKLLSERICNNGVKRHLLKSLSDKYIDLLLS